MLSGVHLDSILVLQGEVRKQRRRMLKKICTRLSWLQERLLKPLHQKGRHFALPESTPNTTK
ncbi:hypothetical protein LINPERPRIM_LOCUS25212 [Linum perenne]